MIDDRFSAASFERSGLDTEAARALASALADEIQQELHTVVLPVFRRIVEMLNALGHDLRPEGEQKAGELSFRDDSGDDSSYICKLRVALDLVISTGYAHLISPSDLYAQYDER